MECLKGYCAYFFFLFLHTIPSWLRVRNYDTTNDSTDEAGCNMRAILGCTKDTAAAAMRYVLGYPTMQERHRLAHMRSQSAKGSNSVLN